MNKNNLSSTFSLVNFYGQHSLSFWLSIIIVLFLVLITAYLSVSYYKKQVFSEKSSPILWHDSIDFIINAAKNPFLLLLSIYIVYAILNISSILFPAILGEAALFFLSYFVRVIEFIVFLWLVINALRQAKKSLLAWSAKTDNNFFHMIFPMISNSLQAVIFLVIMNILFSELEGAGLPGQFMERLTNILLIGVVGWIYIQIINLLEKIIINQYISQNPQDITARKIHTQVTLLKKIMAGLGIVITVAAMLMVFDSVKSIGMGLLTTAGVVSAVGAFASQHSLGRIFAGLQIAFTQPIKIGDTVIIEEELGEVEDITLSYIVIKLWDLRRLILPSDYFENKGLQNLTRESTQLLGTLFLYGDYNFPVDQVRKKFFEYLGDSSLWDKKISAFEVTNIKETCMEIRALMSADNVGNLWRLRCEMREKLMAYIVENFPDSLPKMRYITLENNKKAF